MLYKSQKGKKKSTSSFHAVTSCDTAPQFVGIGKVSAWKIFESCPKLLQCNTARK